MITAACDICKRETSVARMVSVIVDGQIGRICPRCASTQKPHLSVPYAPRVDQGAIQPSTSRDVW